MTSAAAQPATRRARIGVPRGAIERGMRALDPRRRRRLHASARGLVGLLDDFVQREATPLGQAIGADTPCVWQQYALDAARMQRPGGLFFFYHSHDRTPHGEHGHFHVFSALGGAGAEGPPRYTHLVGIGVDARGLPRRLFTTNRWVTNECWRDARTVMSAIERILAAHPRAADPVERWLRGLLTVFTPQIALLVARRDARVRAHGGERVFEDRRMYILSECRVSLADQMAAVDSVFP